MCPKVEEDVFKMSIKDHKTQDVDITNIIEHPENEEELSMDVEESQEIVSKKSLFVGN